MNIKPILFNTEMVKAVLDGIKHCTRRVVKGYIPKDAKFGYTAFTPKGCISCRGIFEDGYGEKFFKMPYQKGDILYVRETWFKGLKRYMYRADYTDSEKYYQNGEEVNMKWKPSIHMPKKAARIWLKVTDVRVERLQDITEEQACMEGTDPWDEACYENNGWHPTLSDPDSGGDPNMIDGFHKLWNSTIKKTDLDRYGWDANPFVWVIEFERCEEPEGDE